MLDELKPDIGKAAFAQHLPELEQGLRQMATALWANAGTDIPGFFRDFMTGYWGPFEELCGEIAKRLVSITSKIQTLEKTLLELMTPEHRPLLEQYSSLLADRNSTALEYAFLIGYQCAIRFILMGIVPMSKFLKEESPS